MLGVHYVGKDGLKSYANAFGFNHSITFDMPVKPSYMALTDDPYQWAEVASGFNRTTSISPLHGAMMVSAIVANGGKMVEPIVVGRIIDDQGRTVYTGKQKTLNQTIRPQSTAIMKTLMEETIKTGTCRKAFLHHENDPVLSRLNIGGKTGTINSRTYQGRKYDWFVGFAEEKGGQEKLVISIVVAHDKVIGLKANRFGRLAIHEYFSNYFSKQPVRYSETDILPPDTPQAAVAAAQEPESSDTDNIRTVKN
jgi:cell division protein FtsI/penicillin-binding protein 2